MMKNINIKENKGKCGIYRWTCLSSKKSYIRSSVDLGRRFKYYYNIYFLKIEIKVKLEH